MDCQGFDPLTQTPTLAVAFMEWVETSEEFDSSKKTNKVATSKSKKEKKAAPMDCRSCTFVAWQHDTSECETLQAQAMMLKGNNGDSDKNGKNHNKP